MFGILVDELLNVLYIYICLSMQVNLSGEMKNINWVLVYRVKKKLLVNGVERELCVSGKLGNVELYVLFILNSKLK